MIRILVLLFIVSGCSKLVPCFKEPVPGLRTKLFQECLKLIPKGPTHTKYNDWAEVVDSCGDQAYYQSLRGCEK